MEDRKPAPVSDPSAPTPNADKFEVTLENVHDVFQYHPWDPVQVAAGERVRNVLVEACTTILLNVPRCPARTRALNMLVDARMLANAAITHHGTLTQNRG